MLFQCYFNINITSKVASKIMLFLFYLCIVFLCSLYEFHGLSYLFYYYTHSGITNNANTVSGVLPPNLSLVRISAPQRTNRLPVITKNIIMKVAITKSFPHNFNKEELSESQK